MQTDKAVIWSGGGAHGSFGVGLGKVQNKDYKIASCISTGSLIGPLGMLGRWDILEEAYTSVDLSVFNVSPFTKKGEFRYLHALKRIAQVKGSFGEMYPLRTKLIPKYYTKDLHKQLQQLYVTKGKEVIVHSVNIGYEPSILQAYSSANTEYEEYCDAMFGSCCFWPITNIAMIGGFEHVDGGHRSPMALRTVTKRGYKDIDVVVFQPKRRVVEVRKGYFRNMFKTGFSILSSWRDELMYAALIEACEDAALDPEMTITVYHLPYKLSKNAMYFNKEQMQSWVKLGEQMAFDPEICESF